jgi:ABC-type proline/glycine betaine transport system permease subunit
MAMPWVFVSKITNSKHQITNKFQIPNRLKAIVFFIWDFEFWSRAAQALAPCVVICLFFGICYLEFQ